MTLNGLAEIVVIIAIYTLWPLVALYSAFGPLPILALSCVAGVALFEWVKRDAR